MDDYLKLNANSEQIGYELADIVRSIIRSSISYSDNYSQKHRAAENLVKLIKMVNLADKLDFYKIVDIAVTDMEVKENEWKNRRVNDFYLSLAKVGTKYLIEESCNDNAAGGRASKSMSEFRNKIERLEKNIESFISWRDENERE